MLNKPTIAILALVMVVVIGAGIYAGSTQVKPSSQSDNGATTTTTTTTNTPQEDTAQNDTGKKMISAAEAKNIAQQYIEEPNATAGTPRLDDEQKIYVVPVIMNNSVVGQIEIDAYTGKNVGGAGGVS